MGEGLGVDGGCLLRAKISAPRRPSGLGVEKRPRTR